MSINCRDCQKSHETRMAERDVYENKLAAKDAKIARLSQELHDAGREVHYAYGALATITRVVEDPRIGDGDWLREYLRSVNHRLTYNVRDLRQRAKELRETLEATK